MMILGTCEELGTRAGPVKNFYDRQRVKLVTAERERLLAKLLQEEDPASKAAVVTRLTRKDAK